VLVDSTRDLPGAIGVILKGAIVAIWVTGWLALAAPLGAQPMLEREPIAPIKSPVIEDARKIALGEALFFDPRLSRDDRFACVACHALDQAGNDGRAHSDGLDRRPLLFNVPTIFNAALNFRLNWRGNFRTLEEQNEAVLLDPLLMGANWPELLAKLGGDPDVRRDFIQVYGGPPDRERVLDALAAFQHSLVTPNARFDRYLAGERGAITAEEEQGYRQFKAYGCAACHQGRNVGGNLFQRFGIFADPFADKANVSEADLGRFTLTGNETDRYVFRVPSLRNVAVTAPYFHDGRTQSLAEAVDLMARSQLGRALPPEDVRLIVKFLGTLTGEYRGRPLASAPQDAPRQ
jgi:cytochrome c peroxidase